MRGQGKHRLSLERFDLGRMSEEDIQLWQALIVLSLILALPIIMIQQRRSNYLTPFVRTSALQHTTLWTLKSTFSFFRRDHFSGQHWSHHGLWHTSPTERRTATRTPRYTTGKPFSPNDNLSTWCIRSVFLFTQHFSPFWHLFSIRIWDASTIHQREISRWHRAFDFCVLDGREEREKNT